MPATSDLTIDPDALAARWTACWIMPGDGELAAALLDDLERLFRDASDAAREAGTIEARAAALGHQLFAAVAVEHVKLCLDAGSTERDLEMLFAAKASARLAAAVSGEARAEVVALARRAIARVPLRNRWRAQVILAAALPEAERFALAEQGMARRSAAFDEIGAFAALLPEDRAAEAITATITRAMNGDPGSRWTRLNELGEKLPPERAPPFWREVGQRMVARGLPCHPRILEGALPELPLEAEPKADPDASDADIAALPTRKEQAKALGAVLARRVSRGEIADWADVTGHLVRHLGDARDRAWWDFVWAFTEDLAPVRASVPPGILAGCLEVACSDDDWSGINVELLVATAFHPAALPVFLAALRDLTASKQVRPLLTLAEAVRAAAPDDAAALVGEAVTALRSLAPAERGHHLDVMLDVRDLVPWADTLADWTAYLAEHMEPAPMWLFYEWSSQEVDVLRWLGGDAALLHAARAIDDLARAFPEVGDIRSGSDTR